MPSIFRDKVTVNSVTFNDPTAYPLPGTINWGLDILDGWSDTPELDGDFIALGSVDGEVPPDFMSARGRVIDVGGYVHADSRATAEALWDVVVRDAFPRNQELILTRYETIPKFCRVRASDKKSIEWVGPLAFRWAVPLRAADPFKYGLTPLTGSAGVAGQSTGGRSYPRTYPLEYTTVSSGADDNKVVLVNLGTAESSCIVTQLTGPLTRGGWRLVNETNDGMLSFDVGLDDTDILEIDFQNEIALLNGYPITVTITGDFWRLKPKANVLRLYADFDADAGFAVTAYSAWE